jgi:hypothetical protein
MIRKEGLELLAQHCDGGLKMLIEDIDYCPLSHIQDAHKIYCPYASEDEVLMLKLKGGEDIVFYQCNHFEMDYKQNMEEV